MVLVSLGARGKDCQFPGARQFIGERTVESVGPPPMADRFQPIDGAHGFARLERAPVRRRRRRIGDIQTFRSSFAAANWP